MCPPNSGIKGIAVLTHNLEDILDVFAQQSALPNKDLAEVLTEAADCLEGMTETLLGLGEAPEEALPVLQKVLDWANRVVKEGIPEAEQATKPTVTQNTKTSAVTANQTPAASPATRLSSELVDNLFRLSSENLVLTGQLHNRLQHAVDESSLLREQNRILQQLVIDLDRLGNIQGLGAQQSQQNDDQFDALEMDQYSELHTITARLMEAATDASELTEGVSKHLTTLGSLMLSQNRLLAENQEVVLRTRMTPLSSIASRCQRTVRQACRLTNKQVDLILKGEDTLIDADVLTELIDPLMHLLRNAVDHGIEFTDKRTTLGKKTTGLIILSFSRQGDQVVISCRDDGAGLDCSAIRQKAQQHGLIQAEQQLSDQETARLILIPGFTTRSSTTQVSGRGVGMDVVYSQLQKLKGRITIDSVPGQGSQFDLILPAALTSTHALLVMSQQQQIAVSSRGVEQIFYAGAGTLRNTANNLTYLIDDKVYPAVYLETLLNQKLSKEATEMQRPALLVKDETDSGSVILVQQVLDSQELVVKNLSYYLPSITGVVGASILGDGRVAPVIDLLELVFSDIEYIPLQTVEFTQEVTQNLPDALIIDDSLSARRSMAQFMDDAGFTTRMAIDGMDAIEMVANKHPDIVLVDMEMPRMNGIEFTSHLRADPQTRDIPIIMVTSRATSKHRQQAQQAGVNAYVTKPFPEDDLLQQIHHLLRKQ